MAEELGAAPLPIIDDAPQPTQRGDFSGDEAQRKFRPDVYWYLSFRCNLACKHCSVFSSPDVDTSEDLTTAESMLVIEQMAELNVHTALVSGGEALFRTDALDILRAVDQAEISIGLETNGLLFSDAFLGFARDTQDHNRFRVCISVDGGTAEAHDRVRGPNTFKRIIANLHRMKDYGVGFDIQCILNKRNYSSIPNLFAEARRLQPQLENLQFGFLNPVGRGSGYVEEVGLDHHDLKRILTLIRTEEKNFDGTIVVKAPPAAIPPNYLGLIYKTPNMRGCMTCMFPLLGVLPNGDVTICAVSRDNDEICYGNVKSHRLKDIWTKTRMDMLRSRYVAAESLTGICGDCVWQRSCKGSCRAWAYEEGGSFDAPFPICAQLEQTGQFPDVYRLSHQQKALGDRAVPAGSLLAHGGCAC